ncbi:LON peptidase N-terminal domain and RING finger protein 2 [Fusarium odoratissimum]|uniref:LON peptidase N-terminal domain and RING finger protein 2 n=1 Tax=Fusarium oxysporum f. sp. cubense (strain race 4) TaxID=2502994 RepID=N1S0V7_FUSC4|nr:LON peptidase N-terminal domain and RING finger protein 2 [Fusarium odoratissimum]
MSSEGTSQAAATDSASGPGPRQSRTPDPPTDFDHEPPDSGRQPTQVTQSQSPSANASRHRDVAPRDFVRLFQCQICSLPLDEPISLPCGKSLCRRCLPGTHMRANITYPAAPERLRGFKCPFEDCNKEHAIGDCAVDVVLNKTAQHVREEIERFKNESSTTELATKVMWPDPWAAAGVSSMRDDDEAYTKVIPGGKVIATYRLAEEGDLSYEADICYDEITSATPSPPPDADDTGLVRKAQDATRAEMDCQEVNARKEALDAERVAQMQDYDLALFVCTLSFPQMPTFLHIFEPRYRLMIRRALEGDHTFGMVIPKRPQHAGDANFHELGTLLRIVNVQFFPDGRSLIETVGLSRFRVLEHSYLDGYIVGKTERIDDVSLEDEEAAEAAEATPIETEDQQQPMQAMDTVKEPTEPTPTSPLPRSDSSSPHIPTSVTEIDSMSTQSLMHYASSFVARMRQQSVPWLTERMLTIYGDCPEDPAIFPWWFASMLPVKDIEKYRLLGTSSVRERLKICCTWIVEWETSRW